MLPRPGSNVNLHQFPAEDSEFDLLELLRDDNITFESSSQQANQLLGSYPRKNGTTDPPGESVYHNAFSNGSAVQQAVRLVQGVEPEHLESAAAPAAVAAGSTLDKPWTNLSVQDFVSCLQQPQQVRQLSSQRQQQQVPDQLGPIDVPAKASTSADQIQHTQPLSLAAWPTTAPQTVGSVHQQLLASQSAAAAPAGRAQLRAATSSNNFSTYDNAAELAAAAQAKLNAAANQPTVAAQVSLTSAVNAAAAQLLAGGFSAATAQLQQQLQRQQGTAVPQPQISADISAVSASPAAPGALHIPGTAAFQATAVPAELTPPVVSAGAAGPHSMPNLGLPQHPQFARRPSMQLPAGPFSPTSSAGTPATPQYNLNSSSTVSPAGFPAAPFFPGALAGTPATSKSTTAVPAAAATTPTSGLAAVGSGGSAASGSGGLAGFQGVMLTPAGASTGVTMGSNLLAWVQGLRKVATQHREHHERSRCKHKRKDKV